MKRNNEKGIINVDYITAIIVFMISSVAILALYISVYKNMSKIKVDETIIGYITEICENIDLVNYSNVDTQEKVNSLINEIEIPEQYSVLCESVEKYADEDNNSLDLVCKINLRVNYSFDSLNRNYVISKVKVKE